MKAISLDTRSCRSLPSPSTSHLTQSQCKGSEAGHVATHVGQDVAWPQGPMLVDASKKRQLLWGRGKDLDRYGHSLWKALHWQGERAMLVVVLIDGAQYLLAGVP